MANQTPEDSAPTAGWRARRGLHVSALFLMLLLIPAGLYAFYVIGQLDQVRTQNLQRLADAANATSELLADVRGTVKALYSREEGSEGWQDGCAFFQRQTRLRLSEPADCAKLPRNDLYQYDSLKMVVEDASLKLRLVLVKSDTQQTGADTAPFTSGHGPVTVVIQVRLDKLLQQIPFGEAFDVVMIVDENGEQLGPAISPTKPSAMRPPGVDVPVETAPVYVLGIAGLALPSAPDKPSTTLEKLGSATFVQSLVIAGRHFDLVCQPMRPDESYTIAADGVEAGGQIDSWHLCGLVDSQRVFRQALSVAPYISVMALALLSLCIVSWPILKLLSVSPHERVHFSDVYMMLISTLALTMLLAVAVADVTTHLALRERSYVRLESLAATLATRLRHEITAMHEQLREYDERLVASQSAVMELAADTGKSSFAMTQLLLPVEQRAAHTSPVAGQAIAGLPLPPPTAYPALNLVFWMRPCDGQQFIKGSALNFTTPTVSLSGREYFRAVSSDRLWNLGDQNGKPVRLFAETASSISTGEFFAVVSALSRLSDKKDFPAVVADRAKDKDELEPEAGRVLRDCNPPENSRFVAALTGQLESLHYPVLAPGVGFAIIDSAGTVLVHSDQRRSLYDKLLKDAGIAARLRAVMEAHTSARLYAHYQTRPHQLFIVPIKDLPWFVVTFVDDEVLRTLNTEVIVNAIVLVTSYLVAAVVVTLVYLLVRGRNPPLAIWPRRDPRLRPVYLWTLWGLGAQLAIFLLALSVLRGWVLLIAAVLLPLPAMAAVTLAAQMAARVQADTKQPPLRPARLHLWLLGTSTALTIFLFALMRFKDPVSSAFAHAGISTVAAAIGAATVLMLAALAIRKYPATFLYLVGPAPRWLRRWRDPLTPHIACSVLLWLLVGALPGWGFFKFALQEQLVRWMQLEQSYVGDARQWRDCQLRKDDRQIQVPEKTTRRDEIERRIPHDEANAEGLNAIYPAALLLQDLLPGVQVGAQFSGETGVDALQSASKTLSKHAPVYNETTTYARYLERPVLTAGNGGAGAPIAWSWQLHEGAAVLRHHSAGAGSCSGSPVELIGLPRTIDPVFGWWGWLLGGLCIASLYALSSFYTRKLCFGDIEEEAGATGIAHAEGESRCRNSDLQDLPDLRWLEGEVASLQDSGLEWSRETLLQWCNDSTSRRSVVDKILKQATPHYLELWNSLSAEGKLLLHQLAQERFANPKQTDLVRHLLLRGLLRRDPVLRIMNDSFAVFVLAQLPPAEVIALESDSAGWHRLRGVLLAALVPLILFLTFTQRDAVEVWIAYLGTAAAGAAGIFKLFGMFSRSGDQKMGG